MKIAVWHNLPSGGGKRALYNHAKGLVERGHTVEAWCPSTSNRTYLPLGDLVPEHVIPFNWKRKSVRGRIKGMLANYQNAGSHIRAMDETCRRCADEINAGGFDLLFANTCAFYAAPFVARYVNLPKILYLQEPHRVYYEAIPALPWIAEAQEKGWSLRFRAYRAIMDLLRVQAIRDQAREEWLNARACDRILVNSYFSLESVRRVYGMDATVCYLGIDTNLFRKMQKDKEDFVVGLGSFFPNKGLGFALESLALIPAPRPKLVWVGNDGPESYVQEKLRQAQGLGVNLEIVRLITDDEMVDLLNRARLLIYTPYLEPFGFAPLEANACAMPVVAVAEGGVRETVRDGVNGFLVERDPAAVATAIERLRNDPALACRLGENGRALVEKEWNLSRSIDSLEKYLREGITTRRSTAGNGA